MQIKFVKNKTFNLKPSTINIHLPTKLDLVNAYT